MEPSEELKRPRILVVDDEPAAVDLLRMMLETKGYRTLLAYSGREAMEMIEQVARQLDPWAPLPIDLVLLDIMMPGVDGYKVCQRIKEDPDLRSIPVIMVTALEKPSDRIAAITFGADDYMTKPFLADELEAMIQAKLQVKRREDEFRLRYQRLKLIDRVSAAAASTLNLRQALEGALDALMREGDLSAAAFYMADEEAGNFERICQAGIVRPERMGKEEPPASSLLACRQLLIKPNLASDAEIPADSLEAEVKPLSFVGVPIQVREHLLGFVEVYHPYAYRYDEDDLAMFRTIGDRLGVAMENALLFQQAQQLLLESTRMRRDVGS